MPQMLDDKKITLVVICKDGQEIKRQLEFISSLKFHVPAGFSKFQIDARFDVIDGNLAKTCNKVLKEIDARYKIFLTSPVDALVMELITAMIGKFFEYPKVGMIGLFGSELPISGDYTKAKNLYGVYYYKSDSGEVVLHNGKMPIFYQSVHIIDSGIFAMSGNIPFDEMVGDEFFIASQCCRYRRAGLDVGVMYIEGIKIIFSADNFMYNSKDDVDNYQEKLKQFVTLYKDIVTPLVSICIPTYNQPHFFEIALQSALNQTYPNIEVIVGDDSTNDDTEKLIQPYLARYSNLKYFHHDKPLGKKGIVNTTFTIDKSSGEYINVLFHDDVLMDTKISRMMEYFIRDLNEKINLVVSARMVIDEKGQTIGRMNPLQPLEDTVMDGKDVCRKILFSYTNFLGELSTCLIRKEDILTLNPLNGEKIFDIGVFCGVKDVAYGDIGTWLNLLKAGGECIFIKDILSAFRRHSAQNTNDPYILIRLNLEWLNYLTIAWVNNIIFHDWEEYKLCCRRWQQNFDNHPPINENVTLTDDMELWLSVMEEARNFVVIEKFVEVLDCSIRFLLSVLPGNNSIRPLVHMNLETGLWEKANDGIMLHGDQRC